VSGPHHRRLKRSPRRPSPSPDSAARFAALSVISLILIGALPPTVRATPARGELQDCVSTALAHGTGIGIERSELKTTFLLAGDSSVFAERLSGDGCVGFVVAGARQVQSLELLLQSARGEVLARSAKPTSLAFASHCGRRGEVILATARMLDGQGEIVYVAVRGANTRPTALDELDRCPALGAVRPAALDVGPDPAGRSIEQELAATHAQLAELGYFAPRVLAYGTVQTAQHDASGVVLAPDHCYAILAVGSEEIVDLDLRVFGPNLPLSAAGSDLSRRRTALVKLCASAPARYVLDVATFQGEGAYAIESLELRESAVAPGIHGLARIAYAESLARMRARGFVTHVVTTGIVAPDASLEIPLPLSAGTCYALAAVDSAEQPSIALQLGLTGEHGELLALDTRPEQSSLIYHCAQHAELVHAVVRSSQARNEARFVLLMGSDAVTGVP
jgi:hypothetical protein